jgi:uncharacterized protein YacL
MAAIYAGIAWFVAVGIVFFEARFQRNLAREMVAIAFGLAAGIMVSSFLLLITLVFVLPSTNGDVGKAFEYIQMWVPLIMTAVCYMAVTIVLQTKGDFRFLLPYIDFSEKGQQEGGFLLDTSAIIDGRVVEVCATNLIARSLIIPDFVIRELQTIADSSDKLKRKRGRRGLDMVNELQASPDVHVQIYESEMTLPAEVDRALVVLAQELNSRIMTNDFNLNKVAQIEGVRVINMNDLSNALKPVVVPGEKMTVRIIRKGEEDGQGVGYLDDGTMVVVENAAAQVEKAVTICITGSIQTSAGRLVFGRYGEMPAESDSSSARPAKEKRRG